MKIFEWLQVAAVTAAHLVVMVIYWFIIKEILHFFGYNESVSVSVITAAAFVLIEINALKKQTFSALLPMEEEE